MRCQRTAARWCRCRCNWDDAITSTFSRNSPCLNASTGRWPVHGWLTRAWPCQFWKNLAPPARPDHRSRCR